MSARETVEALVAQAAAARGADDALAALEAMARAAMLAPHDSRIARLRAQMALDAGSPAAHLFEAALALSPGDEDARLGLTSALVAEGRHSDAEARLTAWTTADPAWIAGQDALARLRHMLGHPHPAEGFSKAIAARPGDAALRLHHIALAMHGGDHGLALARVDEAVAALGPGPVWTAHRAACLDELGRTGEAADAFAAHGEPADPATAVRLVRHLLRRRDPAAVERAARPLLGGPQGGALWPYVALAWRLAGDARADWLEGQAGLVSVIDLPMTADALAALAARLRALHAMRCAPIDQSLRGGTQTDGYLLARQEPELRGLRAALVDATRQHLAGLPRRDPFHPVLRHRRDAIPPFVGAWSVRLTGGGHHVAHVHPLGWFSSAFYVGLPGGTTDQDGWLALGEPEAELGLDLPPLRMVEPRPGRLALFPSTMWHGTRPFPAGERLTVAFDVARPE